MNKSKFWFWLAIIMVTLVVSSQFKKEAPSKEYSLGEVINKIEAGQVKDATVSYEVIEGTTNGGEKFMAKLTPFYNEKIIDKLIEKKVNVEILNGEKSTVGSKIGRFLLGILSWLPMILMIVLWVYAAKQMNNGPGKAFSFARSKAKMLTEKDIKVTFADVAGINEAKQELEEVVDFLKNPRRFQKIGAKIPKGCLLIGSPGTGKTLLAKAIAGEAKVPFFFVSGSDFVEMFVGVGASRVREMFAQAKKNAPCIVFIDEIDAVGRHRGIGLGGGNDEREQTLNQMLVEMDGFEDNSGIVIIAATNRPDVLDPALLRPGRFDRQVVVPLPDVKGREEVLRVHLKKIKIAPYIEVSQIARGTPGFSGADLANLVNEAALTAVRGGKNIVTLQDLEHAKDKVMMGSERKSLVMSEEEKKLTAYHEGGHAIVGLNLPASDPIHKATIMPRGRALGMVMRLPEKDRLSVTRAKMKADIAVAMGGRVAEEMIFGYDKVTSGASSDIEYATKMAKAMATEWGLSDKMGPIYYGGEKQDKYLGGGASAGNHSDKMSELIDGEVKKFVEEGYQMAQKILTEKMDELHILASALLEYETLSGEDIAAVLKGEKLDRDHASSPQEAQGKPSIPGLGGFSKFSTQNNEPNPNQDEQQS